MPRGTPRSTVSTITITLPLLLLPNASTAFSNNTSAIRTRRKRGSQRSTNNTLRLRRAGTPRRDTQGDIPPNRNLGRLRSRRRHGSRSTGRHGSSSTGRRRRMQDSSSSSNGREGATCPGSTRIYGICTRRPGHRDMSRRGRVRVDRGRSLDGGEGIIHDDLRFVDFCVGYVRRGLLSHVICISKEYIMIATCGRVRTYSLARRTYNIINTHLPLPCPIPQATPPTSVFPSYNISPLPSHETHQTAPAPPKSSPNPSSSPRTASAPPWPPVRTPRS